MGCGYLPATNGGRVGPDGERHEDTEEATRLGFTAAAFAAADQRPDPMEAALADIAEEAAVPVGQTLLTPAERIRALTTRIERIGRIASAETKAGGQDG